MYGKSDTTEYVIIYLRHCQLIYFTFVNFRLEHEKSRMGKPAGSQNRFPNRQLEPPLPV